jgi:hypothetical protein
MFLGIVIRMYFDEHALPRFHVIYNEFESTVSIEHLTVIKGSLPGRVQGLVVEWSAEHRQELLANWDLCERHDMPQKIKPLV